MSEARPTSRAKPAASTSGRRRRPARGEAERREKLDRILAAALIVFAEKGFADTRLDDVATRAGVAKGTIYLYVSSKTALFEALVRSAIGQTIGAIEDKVTAIDAPVEVLLKAMLAQIRTEVLETDRSGIVRLVLAEAWRFPELAELYHREVIARGMRLLRKLAERAVARGEFGSDELVRFPQLVVAPFLVALIWGNLFQRFEPLDTAAMLDTHVDLIMRAMRAGA